ncbi:hypothetical protein NY78_2163 [Desulfovibrio sp. TomC]|nr:hypothetical protein NY78_2163 [Desulfovibrio sp. TomC]
MSSEPVLAGARLGQGCGPASRRRLLCKRAARPGGRPWRARPVGPGNELGPVRGQGATRPGPWERPAVSKHRSTAGEKEKNVKHPVKKYLRAGARAIIFLAITAVAAWYGLVFLLVHRAD